MTSLRSSFASFTSFTSFASFASLVAAFAALPLVLNGCVLFLPPVPVEDAPCLDGDVCAAGLTCVDGVCTREVAAPDACPAPGVPGPECDGAVTCAVVAPPAYDEVRCGDVTVGRCAFGCASATVCPGVARSPLDPFEASTAEVADLVLDGPHTLVLTSDDEVSLVRDADGAGATTLDAAGCLGIELGVSDAADVAPGQAPLIVLRARRIELLPGASLSVDAAGFPCGGLAVLADTDLVVHDSAAIDLGARGQEPGCGGFAGGDAGVAGRAPETSTPAGPGSGGSHATRGAGPEAGGVYDASDLVPLLGGAGGGGAVAASGGPGGGGGGALYLSAHRAVRVAGDIVLVGAAGVDGGGAGAGGALLVEAGSVELYVDNDGTIDDADFARVRVSGGDAGADGLAGAGRVRFRKGDVENLFNPDNSFVREIVDVGQAGDRLCTTIVDFVGARADFQGVALFREPEPAPIFFVDVDEHFPGSVATIDPLAALAAQSVGGGGVPDVAVLSDGELLHVFTQAGVAAFTIDPPGDTAIDGVALDVTTSLIALGMGADIVVFTLPPDTPDTPLFQLNGVRAAGAPLAVAGEHIAWVGLGAEDEVEMHHATTGALSPLQAPAAVVALAGREHVLLIGIDGPGNDTATQGIVPAFFDGTAFAVDADERNHALFFQAPPSAIAIGAPHAVDSETVTLAAVAASLDDACGTDAGGVVVIQILHPRAAPNGHGFLLDPRAVVDAWDPRPGARMGTHVAMATTSFDRVVSDMGAAGSMIVRDDRSRFVFERADPLALAALTAVSGFVVVVDADGNVLAAPIPPDP